MKWQIDPVHSSLTFGVRHMMVSTVKGHVSGLAGSLELDPDSPEKGRIEVTADASTITTNEPRRDGHLRSPDFFDAATYPRISFRSTAVRPKADGRLEVEGDLEIRGVTRRITADAEIDGVWEDPDRGKRAGLTGTATIDRRDWGLVWNQPIANGGLLVGEKVRIELTLAAVAAVAQEAKAA